MRDVCLQVYKGLDVATNKATEEETDGVPHHMMGTVDWGYECNVHQYRNEALKIVSFSSDTQVFVTSREPVKRNIEKKRSLGLWPSGARVRAD